MMKTSACLNCKERIIGCHQNCEKYKQYKQYLETIKQNKIKEREKYKKPIRKGKR